MSDYNSGNHCPDCGGDNGSHYPGCTYEGTGSEHYSGGSGDGLSFLGISCTMIIGFFATVFLITELGIDMDKIPSFVFLVIYVIVTVVVGVIISKLK